MGSNLNANLNIFIQLTLFLDLIFSILEIIERYLYIRGLNYI